MKKDLLWTEAKDVWFVTVDPLWADFEGTPATDSRPVPFIDAFPLTLWMYKDESELPAPTKDPKTAKMHLLVNWLFRNVYQSFRTFWALMLGYFVQYDVSSDNVLKLLLFISEEHRL